MKIVIAGGQTGGPIIPLLAVAEEIRRIRPHTQILVMDTPSSAGRHVAEKEKLGFQPIHTGKFRRYWSVLTFLSPFAVAWGYFEALFALRRFRADAVLGAGGFVQVPVVWAAWTLGIPVLLHQQDMRVSLSNTLSAPFAKKITVTFEESARHFHVGSGFFRAKRRRQEMVIWTGNPFRESLAEGKKTQAVSYFHLKNDLPVLLVTGGGGGAAALNDLVFKSLPVLHKTLQIIHSTGPGKKIHQATVNYHPFEFIDRMDLAYAAADLVLGRAGISTITELANLGKVGIIIPMPGTHQEENASLLYDREAAIALDQTITTPDELTRIIRKLLLDGPMQKHLRKNISGIMPEKSAEKIAKLVIDLHNNGK